MSLTFIHDDLPTIWEALSDLSYLKDKHKQYTPKIFFTKSCRKYEKSARENILKSLTQEAIKDYWYTDSKTPRNPKEICWNSQHLKRCKTPN